MWRGSPPDSSSNTSRFPELLRNARGIWYLILTRIINRVLRAPLLGNFLKNITLENKFIWTEHEEILTMSVKAAL
jgi:hypothetical protein